MKFIGKTLLAFFLLVLLTLITSGFLLQTRWGAAQLSRWVTQHTAYRLSVEKAEYRFSTPSHLILHNVSFGYKKQPAVIVAQEINLGLALHQINAPLHFSSIELQQGVVTLNNMPEGAFGTLQADRLQLKNMDINGPQASLTINARGVTGGILPWHPHKHNLAGNRASFQVSATMLSLNNLQSHHVLLQGRTDNGQWWLDNIGADLARGSATGNAHFDGQGNWEVTALRLNNIRWQTRQALTEFLQPLRQLPSVHFVRVDMTNAQLQGAEWAVSDLSLTLKNLTLHHDSWQSESGSLSLSASNVINHQLTLSDPIINLGFSSQGIAVNQFSSRWVNGVIRTRGYWSRQNKCLTLDELALAGVELTLPENWRDRWMASLPDWLEGVVIKKFSSDHNLIIDINPQYPFQITALNGEGEQLLLARQHQWGLWDGSLTLSAADATFNRTDIRHPSLSLTASDKVIQINEMSALAGEGIIEGRATADQTPARYVSLTLNGQSVPMNLMHNWGWPETTLTGNGSLTLQLNAQLAADKPLASTLEGTLTLNNGSATEIKKQGKEG